MQSNTHRGVALGVSAAIMLVTSYLSHHLLNMFFAALSDPFAEGPAVSTTVLVVLSLLFGALATMMSFRMVGKLISEFGFPGVIPAPHPLDGKNVRVSLIALVRSKDKDEPIRKEVISGYVKAERLAKFFHEGAGDKLTIRSAEGFRLTITRPLSSELESDRDESTILVKFATHRRTLLSLEKLPGSRGTLEYSEDLRNASCKYTLTHVGCSDKHATSTLFLWGATKVMKALFKTS